jgi:transposase-like protein
LTFTEVPIIKKYSTAFKMKVVREIERGKFSIDRAREIYDIGGSETIQKWMKKLGKADLISKVVRIEMKDEQDKLKQLKKEKHELESALAQSQVKIIGLESLLEAAEEEYGFDLKKTLEKRRSKGKKQRSDR